MVLFLRWGWHNFLSWLTLWIDNQAGYKVAARSVDLDPHLYMCICHRGNLYRGSKSGKEVRVA